MTDMPPPPPRTPRGVHRAALDSGSLFYNVPSLVFLLYILIPAWTELSVPRALLVTLICALYAVLFAYTAGLRAYPVRDRLVWLAAAWALLGALWGVIGLEVLYMVMFQQVMHGIILPLRWARVTVPVIAVSVLVGAATTDRPIAAVLALVGLVLSLGLAEGIERAILQERLDEAERRNAHLAVAVERERIGRDLHDILGHSLTTITVTAQLAQRLLPTDPEAARARLGEIERISRQSLADVRTTVSGMQEVRAAHEIAAARSVLGAAGIEAVTPTALPELSEERSELFGYAIREGVTNVVRHAGASRCTLTLEEDEVQVLDDGTGLPPSRALSGLAGLRRRLEAAGGSLEIASPPPSGSGTLLIARVPHDSSPA